jgi:hypothetical protein
LAFFVAAGKMIRKSTLDYYKKMVDAAAKQNIQRPLYINNHSGRDHFSFDDNKKFIEHTLALGKRNRDHYLP